MNVTAHPALAASDAEDFTAYVRDRSAALLRTAYLITGNQFDAEDLLQTALAKVYLAWPRIREVNARDAYVRRALVNTQTSRWRRRRVAECPTENLPETVVVHDPFGTHDLHDALWTALAKLSPRQRTTVVLRYYLDLSEAETAATMRVSPGTVKSTMHHALNRLREDVTLRDDVALGESRVAPRRPQLAAAA
jgi:RNA polymerase sigma-70 factor (sigma-E family)